MEATRCPSLGTDPRAGVGPVPVQGSDPVSSGEVVRVEHKGSEGQEGLGVGRRHDSGHPEVNYGEPQAGNDGTYPVSEESRSEGRRSLDSKQDLAYWITWQTTLYALVLGILCVFLVPLTNFWWIVPVLGAAVPLVLAMLLNKSGSVPKKLDAINKEQELLEALAERGELTPTTAAVRTSLTVDEASKMLDELAGKGHLILQTQDGIMAYSLPERDRSPAKDAALETSLARSEADAASAKRLDDPLSERELEVLTLLASGRTNAEISRDLFVAVGTVKSHVNNIYRKLGAANRAEAVTLARVYIIQDAEENALPLPKRDKEIPLMICDRSFAEDGSFLYPSVDPSLRGEPGVTREFMQGVLGDVILVNGVPWPYLEVSNTRYRFRILNASNARRYELTLDPEPREGASFIQVGSDGGLLGAPISHRTIPIAQAERFDVVIDFSGYPVGTTVKLANRLGDDRTAEVMQFRVVRKEKEESTVPERLSDTSEFDTLDETIAEVQRTFRFTPGGQRNGMPLWTINGKPFDSARIDARPRLGSTEIWELTAGPAHPVHLHLVHFKVLSRNNGEPLPTDAGWKDTVDLTAGERATVIARFDSNKGKYVFHCHNLEHEDMMMMANFEVV